MPTNKFKHVLIFGPVAANQIASRLQIPSDWSIQFVNQAPTPPGTTFYENGSAAFAYLVGKISGDIFEHYAPGSGKIILGSFSAGHGALEWIFAQHAGDKRLRGVCCGDSYYTDEQTFKARKAKPGYLRQAQLSANGGPPFLMMSGKTAGPGYVSSSDATSVLAEKIGATSTDGRTYNKGNFFWNDMGTDWTHTEHATVGLPDMLNYAVNYEDSRPFIDPGLDKIAKGIDDQILTFGLLAVAAYFALGGKKK